VTRRALVVEQPGSIAVVKREDLHPGPGEVVARPAYCGICRTDLELLAGEVDSAFVRYPLTLGHEWSGRVEAVGEGVAGIEPGQRCVAEGIIPCGVCASCLAGATNVCEIYDEVGFTREGGAGDQILVPARVVHALDESVSLLDAAVVEPSAVVLTGLEKISPRPGLRVLVVGDGTIALLAVLLAGLGPPPSSSLPVAAPSRRNSRGSSARRTSHSIRRRADSISRSKQPARQTRLSRRSEPFDAAGRSCSSAFPRPARRSSCRATCSSTTT